VNGKWMSPAGASGRVAAKRCPNYRTSTYKEKKEQVSYSATPAKMGAK